MYNPIYIYIYIATLKSSDRTKQVCLWMTIYMLYGNHGGRLF